MKDEIRDQIPNEIVVNNEKLLYPEHEVYKELADVKEISAANEVNEKKAKTAKTKSTMSKITGPLVTIVAASAFGVTTLLNVRMSAQFESAEFKDGHIAYAINVSDITDKQTLILHLKDGKEEIDVIDLSEAAVASKDGKVEGKIEFTTDMVNDIKERIQDKNTDVTFNLTLTGNVGLSVERVFDNYAVQFYHAESRFDPENGIEGECHCSEDGYYYFKLNFYDDYGIFSNFQARIEDGQGNVSECTTLNDDNAHEQQKILVANMKSSKCTLYVTCDVHDEKTYTKELTMEINL